MTNAPAEGQEQQPYEPLNPNHPRLAIKHGSAFLLTDMEGMVPGEKAQGTGYYENDTRWISRWELTLNGKPLFLLNGDVGDGYAAKFVSSNSSENKPGDLPAQSLMIVRELVINEHLTERVTVKNYAEQALTLELVMHFAADFADMFEVRGTVRKRRGELKKPRLSGDKRRVVLSYKGLDDVLRETYIDFLKARPVELTENKAVFRIRLKHHESRELLFHVSTRTGGGRLELPRPKLTFDQERTVAEARYNGWLGWNALVHTDNREFNTAMQRAYNDVYVLMQHNELGSFPAAGIPWFACAFGRDSFWLSRQTLPFVPDLSRHVLSFFTHYQGTKTDEELCEEPGKMPHEIRMGEMAKCAEIAFRPYYGTVDATQLWLSLLWAYVKQTGDVSFAESIWSHVEAADKYLTTATDGGAKYITYGGKPGQALSNQGWKDSGNSIMHADGTQAKGPIAVCEAQGYLHEAWEGTAKLADLLGKGEYATELRKKAAALKSRFEKDFWLEDKQFFAIALDGDGKKCAVVSSNPGHLLGTGILSSEKELVVAERLMRDDMFSGWGVRTLSADETAYQPMDYQRGAIWPHENGYMAGEMAKLGLSDHAHRIFEGMLATARYRQDGRLPELFCGFARGRNEAPIRYPVACVPQAWAAGCWFQMLFGMINVELDGLHNKLIVRTPALPAWLGKVSITGLKIADSEIDLEFTPTDSGKTQCRVTRQFGEVEVVFES